MEGSSRAAPVTVDIKKLINKIFQTKGVPEVKNFPKEFCDGSKRSLAAHYLFSPFPGTL